jgi:hypothetical protein
VLQLDPPEFDSASTPAELLLSSATAFAPSPAANASTIARQRAVVAAAVVAAAAVAPSILGTDRPSALASHKVRPRRSFVRRDENE